MVVLALETVTRTGSVALLRGETLTLREGDPAQPHGQRLPREILDLLAGEHLGLREVDLFAVVSGPGSFTGLRVGMATVQGLSLAAGRRVVAVPTLETMVAAWQGGRSAEPVVVVPCLDGQRGDVFFAAYHAGGPPSAAGWPVLLPPAVAKPDEAVRIIAARMAGAPVVLVGSGADRYAESLTRLPSARVEPLQVPLAAAAARLALLRAQSSVRPHALQPVYVRRPDAVLARERSQQAESSHQNLDLDAFRVEEAHTPADLKAVELLQQRAFDRHWGAESFLWELDPNQVARVYVMRAPSGELVAYCACWLLVDELHLNSVAVDPRWRRHGLATRLLERVGREARARGATSATLEVRESNQAARALYERLGFQVEGVRRDYYDTPREDAIILWNRSL